MMKTCSRRRRSSQQRLSAPHADSFDSCGNHHMPSGPAAKKHGRRHKASTQTTSTAPAVAQRTTQVRNQESGQLLAKGKSKQRRNTRKVQGRKRAENIQASCMYLMGSPNNANEANSVEAKEVKREPRMVKFKLTARAPVVQTQGARAHDVQAFQDLIKSGKTTWATTCHTKARVTQPEPEAEPASGDRSGPPLAVEKQSNTYASPAINGGKSDSTRQEDVERKYEGDATSESTSAASDDDDFELEAQLIGLRTGSFWQRETPRRATPAPTNTPVDGTPTRAASGVSNQACDDSESDGSRSRVATQENGIGDGGASAPHADEEEEEEKEKPWSEDADEWSECAMLEASTGIFTQMSLPASVESETDVAGLLDRVATEGDGGSVSEWLKGSIASVIGWCSLSLGL
jgi:hypothetical protein